MDELFTRNIIVVFFFYGLAFFSMGLAVLLEVSHSSQLDYAQALKPLGVFGLVHGAHEWFEMGLLFNSLVTGEPEPTWVGYLRVVLLAVSFLFLIYFGIRLIIGPGKVRMKVILMTAIILIWYIGLVIVLGQPLPSQDQLIIADVYTRYSLAIPGAALTAWGLLLQRSTLKKYGMQRFSLDVTIAAIAFALYGGIGQLFVSASAIFPSTYLNSTLFLNIFGFPIQGFRALMAIVAAIFIIHSLRIFDEENRQRLQALSEAQKTDEKRLNELRSELLLRTVSAQELERTRIARDLHDDTGQTLTALGLGLQGMAQMIPKNPPRAVQQARQLQQLATDGLSNLQRLVSGLHPPQLDELGLASALRAYAQEINELKQLNVTVVGSVDETGISNEVRLTIFRIVQEAITNAIRHSGASKAVIRIGEVNSEFQLSVEDDGQGFDVEKTLGGSEKNCLGLLGMIERASLIGGNCQIHSLFNVGTTVVVRFNRNGKP